MTAQADLSNWRTPPYNIWAFKNVSKILPTAAISNGDGKANSLESANEQATFAGLKIQKPGTDETLEWPALLEYTNTDGIVVLHKGKVVFEHYGNGNDASTKHIIFSMYALR